MKFLSSNNSRLKACFSPDSSGYSAWIGVLQSQGLGTSRDHTGMPQTVAVPRLDKQIIADGRIGYSHTLNSNQTVKHSFYYFTALIF